MEGILSIQSAVAWGHVGNSAAVFPLQRMGFEVWPVDTVQLSNHAGYPTCRGTSLAPADIDEIVDGIGERGAFPDCRAVVSGYLGDPALGASVLRAVERVREARPGALYVCDPVMGDAHKGLFVRPGISSFFRDQAVAAADILTPNAFELGQLTGRTITGCDDAVEAARMLCDRGPRLVVVTSLELARDGLGVLAVGADGAWLARTPRIEGTFHGTGDAFTALLLGFWLRHGEPGAALGQAVSAIHAIVAATADAGETELCLVAAQDLIEHPPEMFEPERLR